MNAGWTRFCDDIDPEYFHEHECYECKQMKARHEHARDFFDGICEMLSQKSPYNAELLENYLEEVGHALGSKFNFHDLKLQEKISA